MKSLRSILSMLPVLLLLMTSCLGGSGYDFDFNAWLKKNNEYISQAEAATENGVKVYEKITPAWDPTSFVLMKWHKRGTASLNPISNSTLNVKYLLRNIDGDTIDSSYALTDSLFTCRPNEMVTGFWLATTSMVEGDSVTAIVPYTAGYGTSGTTRLLPFSTLVFEIKLDKIVAYETLPWRD